jgi:glycosyltransferase involved in cell wall biosynthesis
MRVDQLVPAYHRGDAIGDEATELKAFFRRQGFESDIICLDCDRGLEGECRRLADGPAPGPADATILHFALASPLTAALRAAPGRKILIHHNITPPEFFREHDPEIARLTRLSREELASLKDDVDLALADSEFNRGELETLGFRRTQVFPLFVDFARYERPSGRFVQGLLRDGRVNILFVGRIAPNKRIENLIKTAFYFKKFVSPMVRLILVGKTGTFPRYYEACVRMADEFHMAPEEVRFLGHVPDAELYAAYRAADVFLSLSEHEGFCLPLLESMVFDLPVIALASTAVPGTLGGAGILLERWRPDETAELVARVARDEAVRGRLIEAGRRELARYKAFPREKVLLDGLKGIL